MSASEPVLAATRSASMAAYVEGGEEGEATQEDDDDDPTTTKQQQQQQQQQQAAPYGVMMNMAPQQQAYLLL